MKTSKKEPTTDLLNKPTHEIRLSARSTVVNNNDNANRLSPGPSRQATSLSPTRQLRDHPFGVPDEECLLNRYIIQGQSFTSLMADLRQDLNRVSSSSRCLNGTFP